MRVYISGIAGTGMGPLALMAKAAGCSVCGSDLAKGAIYDELIDAGVEVYVGEQDGVFLREQLEKGVDWFVYTSALADNHPELVLARKAGVKCTKRDDFTVYLVEKLGLKMVAVAGTHGKTTTTSMIIWAALKLGLPVAYLVGTTLGFAPAGSYKAGDKFFVYEADEYDRNFLKYHPWLAVIPAVSYDHPDIYPTRGDYAAAFQQFREQSEHLIECKEGIVVRRVEKGSGELEQEDLYQSEIFKLAGEARRIDAALAANAVNEMGGGVFSETGDERRGDLVEVMDEFPGVGRRFERIGDGVYSDYAHHPEEIKATMGVAADECRMRDYKGVVVVYQPHQNTRQHKVREGYRGAFEGAKKVYWLPTYLTRENPALSVIMPEEFIAGLVNSEVAEVAEAGEELAEKLRGWLADDYMVLLMTAGPADGWMRDEFGELKY